MEKQTPAPQKRQIVEMLKLVVQTEIENLIEWGYSEELAQRAFNVIDMYNRAMLDTLKQHVNQVKQ